MKRVSFILIVLAAVALTAFGFAYFRDTSSPEIALSPEDGSVSGKRPLTLKLADPGAGLKTVSVIARQGGTSIDLLQQEVAAGTAGAEFSINLVQSGLQEGGLEILVRATDRSLYHFGSGNTTERSYNLTFDNKPPAISVLSVAHNLNQGGAGLVTYTLSEPVEKTGVVLGDLFFPGYQLPSGRYAAFFAFPYNLPQSAFNPRLLAVDQAGNERQGGFFYHTNARSFPTDRINVSPQFLQNKIVPGFQDKFPGVTDPLELFLKVNRDLRAQNKNTLLQLGQQSASRPLWDGVFRRQPNAAVPGSFAQYRTYYYEGREIDHQTHLGIDLASTAQAPVPAANAGIVVYADDLGIYGQCVIIDHGLGLQTLYAHLSQIRVEKGQQVGKDQIIANTGATGLAGGDHLHFDVLVSGQQVNPLEWWDPNWIANNVSAKLQEAMRGSAQ